MVLRHILPPNGGGTLRRWYNLRKDYMHRIFNKKYSFYEPITLFDFRRDHDRADALTLPRNNHNCWRLSDDETIGGYSRGMVNLISSWEEMEAERNLPLEGVLERKSEGGVVESQNRVESWDDEEEEEDSFLPFLRWRGVLSSKIPTNNPDVIRSGYCYLRSPEFRLGAASFSRYYNALEITCRTDGKIYGVNLQTESYIPDDLYKAFIRTEPMEAGGTGEDWMTLIMPFSEFVLTKHGVGVREQQRVLDGAIYIEHIGFLLGDKQDGEFFFDLASIRVVNLINGDVIEQGMDEDEESLEFRRKRGW